MKRYLATLFLTALLSAQAPPAAPPGSDPCPGRGGPRASTDY